MAGGSGRKTRVTSSHWGAFEVDVEDDRIVATRPFAADPHPSAISAIIPEAVHHRSRVRHPSIRRGWLETRARGGRGAEEFVALPWDEALDIAAAEIDRVRKAHGNEAIFGGSYGWGSRRPLPPRAEPAAPVPEHDRRLCRLLRQLFDRLRPGDHAARDRGELPRAALRASGRLADDPRQHRDAGDVRGHQPEELAGQHGRDHRARDRRMVRPLRRQGHALHQHRPAARRRTRRLRVAAAAAGLGHRADAGARPRHRDRRADRPRLPRALHRRLRALPPLPPRRDRRHAQVA